MTDETTKTGPDATVADTSADFAQDTVETVDAVEPSQPDPVELLKAENGELRDRYLRLAAEMDNLRRRTEREVKDAKSYLWQASPATCWRWRITCAARWTPFRLKRALAAMPA